MSESKRKPTNIIEELKERMGQNFLSLDQLRPPEGLATGISIFDDFFLWRGLPKGDLTLLQGKPGAGATKLWLQTVAQIQTQKWVAWVNSDLEILPSHMQAEKTKWLRILVPKKPDQASELFSVLHEMLSSGLFEMIGCNLSQHSLKTQQLQILKKLAHTYQVALVFISYLKQQVLNPLFALVIECDYEFYTVRKALHRPTPFFVPGSMVEHTGGLLC